MAARVFFWNLVAIMLACKCQNNYPADSMINNDEWLDIDGNFIHAHDGSIKLLNITKHFIGLAAHKKWHWK